MRISEVENREVIISSIIKEFSKIGVKIRNQNGKLSNYKRRNQKIFKVPLIHLDLEDALLADGSIVRIPKFVVECCKRIQMELETEGLFRKNGSVKTQKLIQEHYEQEGSFDMSHNVLDVANMLKKFFRELPEPLIPESFQEQLLLCLDHFNHSEGKRISVCWLTLLLPPIVIDTLAYFLQFLHLVIKNSHLNLMTTDNLVTILTPTLMPVLSNAPSTRLHSHFQVIKILIQNAESLGIVPKVILNKENPVIPLLNEEQNKKKRRSGSLNRVFNGFRKIVGATGSSSESLDKSMNDDPRPSTSAANKSKKRQLDNLDAISSCTKKKKDVPTLKSLPEIDDSNSPPNKYNTAKTRKSMDNQKESLSPESSPTSKRRWSIIGGKFTRSKNVATTTQNEEDLKHTEPVADLHSKKQEVQTTVVEIHHPNESYVKVSKSEYESFKDRLITIEAEISHEFNKAKLDAVKAEMGQDDSLLMDGPEKVQNKYKKTLLEVEKLEETERKTDQLAKRMSRELMIRPSNEHAVVRSPSARKIGSLRQRRDSATRLSRTRSWQGRGSPKMFGDQQNVRNFVSTASFYPKSNLKRAKPVQTHGHQVTARPLPALPSVPQQTEKVIPEKPLRSKKESIEQFSTPAKTVVTIEKLGQETWTPATDFFNDSVTMMDVDEPGNQVKNEILFKTPVRPKHLPSSTSTTKTINDEVKTPMLPPRKTPLKRATPSMSTPMKSLDFSLMSKSVFHTPSIADSSSQGRESIIILRNQNAGMVAEKAKLFNGMTDQSENAKPVKISRVVVNKKLENVKSMSLDETPSKNRHSKIASVRSPRKSPRTALKSIREAGGSHKMKWMNSEFLNEINSPKRKPLSQRNTPRRKSKTPNRDSAKKRRQTPSKSPRFARRDQTQDSH